MEDVQKLKQKYFNTLSWESMDEMYGEDATHAWVELENGFELSIVRHRHSYGGDEGLYEVGVFKEGEMVTPLGWDDQVRGYLDPIQVVDTIIELEKHNSEKATSNWSEGLARSLGMSI